MTGTPFNVNFERVVRSRNAHLLQTPFPAGRYQARNAYPAPITNFPRWVLSSNLMSLADMNEVRMLYSETGGGAAKFQWTPPGGATPRDARFVEDSLTIVARNRQFYRVSVTIELLRPQEEA